MIRKPVIIAVLVGALAAVYGKSPMAANLALKSGDHVGIGAETSPVVGLNYAHAVASVFGPHFWFASTFNENGSNPIVVLRSGQPPLGILDRNTPVDGSSDFVDSVLSLTFESSGTGLAGTGSIAALTSNFSRQAHFRFSIDENGALTGLSETIGTADPLPGGGQFSQAEAGQIGGGVFAFPQSDVYLAFPDQSIIAASEGFLMPGSNQPVGFVTRPAAGSEAVVYTARDLFGNGALLVRHYFFRGAQAQFLIDLGNDPFSPPTLVEMGGDVHVLWRGQTPQSQSVVRRMLLDETTPEILVGVNEPISGGSDSVSVPFIPIVGAAIGSDVCVYYPGTLASDPFGDFRLLRTCAAPDDSRETEILLSPGDIIDGETITGFELDPEGADGPYVAVRAFLASGGVAVVAIEPDDPDTDGDGVADSADNCLSVANPPQRDTDADGIGNFCDADIRLPNDCIVNALDLGTLRDAFFSSVGAANWNPDADFNGDGAVNAIDLGVAKSGFFQPPGPSGVANGCDP